MKYIIYIFFFGFVFHCSSATTKEENLKFEPQAARIKSKVDLSLKEKASSKSKTMDSIPVNYIVFVNERTKEKEIIGNSSNYWYKTKFKNQSGWLHGNDLDFDEKEVLLSRTIENTSNTIKNISNYKKIYEYFESNMIRKSYQQIIAIYGNPNSESRFKGSNPHGGYNKYLELIYFDFRLKFIDNALIDVTFFTSEKLTNKLVEIGSELSTLEKEFNVPHYISKEQISYLTCFQDISPCLNGYPGTLVFYLENQKVKSIRLTLFYD